MFFILRVLATVLLAVFGLGMFWFAVHMGKQRDRIEAAYRGTETEEWALRCQRSAPWISGWLGTSFLAAAIFVWVNPIVAALIVVLPFVARFVAPPVARRP